MISVFLMGHFKSVTSWRSFQCLLSYSFTTMTWVSCTLDTSKAQNFRRKTHSPWRRESFHLESLEEKFYFCLFYVNDSTFKSNRLDRLRQNFMNREPVLRVWVLLPCPNQTQMIFPTECICWLRKIAKKRKTFLKCVLSQNLRKTNKTWTT